jgi:hypothetical protein
MPDKVRGIAGDLVHDINRHSEVVLQGVSALDPGGAGAGAGGGGKGGGGGSPEHRGAQVCVFVCVCECEGGG